MHQNVYIMEITNYKKSIGLGLIVLLCVFIINSLVAAIPVMSDSTFYKIRDWWFLLSQVIQATAVIFLAFNRKSQATILSKIGACLYSALMLIYIFNRLSYNFTGESYLYFPGISEYLNTLVFYTPGLLLLVWGLPKLWLPIKIVSTLMIAISIVEDMIWAKLVPMYQNMSDFTFEQTEPLQDTVDLLSHTNIIVIIAALILTIVWLNLKTKAPSAQKHNIDLI